MKLWTFFDPHPDAAPSVERAKEIAVVKEGVAWWALIIPLFWLMWHGLWRDVLIYVGVCIVAGIILSLMPVSAPAAVMMNLLLNFGVAIIGNDLRCAQLQRRGYTEVGVLAGATRLESESIFFDVWLRPEEFQKAMRLEDNRPAVLAPGVEIV